MSDANDPFSFDAEYGDPDFVRSARDPNRPPQPGKEWEHNGRASDIPIEPGGDPSPFRSQTSTMCRHPKTNRIRTATSTPAR